MGRRAFIVFCALVFSLIVPIGVVHADPISLTVDVISDGPDATPSDGICDDGAGHCSLRAAIQTANDPIAAEGAVISFSIGTGAVTIEPGSELPPVTSLGVTIDGTTQPGFFPNGTPIVEISGVSAGGGTGLRFLSGNGVVSGLVVNYWQIGIELAGGNESTRNRISGNYIGTDVTGTIDLGNDVGVLLSTPFGVVGGQFGVTPGGSCTGACNVISGNAINVHLADGGIVVGNMIGLDATGTLAVETDHISPGIGIRVAPSSSPSQFGVTIGSPSPDARNVISGNDDAGIRIGFRPSPLGTINGNFIGTDTTGTIAIGNGVGISATDGGQVMVGESGPIGGSCTDACNLISGNSSGLELGGQPTRDLSVEVAGNFIGTDVTGTIGLGAQNYGIHLFSGFSDASIRRNLISGNAGSPFYMESAFDLSTLRGLFGTDTTGTQVIGNGGPLRIRGDVLLSSVVAGSSGVGVELLDSARVEASFIGTDSSGTIPLGNLGGGVDVLGGDTEVRESIVSHNQGFGIRTSVAGTTLFVAVNRISSNTGPGLEILGSPAGVELGEANVFTNNGGLGIDWNGDGVTSNDSPEADGVPNTPDISDVSMVSPTTTRFESTFVGHAGASVRIDVYRNSACDPSGWGEGAEFLGSGGATVPPGGGPFPISFDLPRTVVGGDVITMAAFQGGPALHHISEFSECFVVGGTAATIPGTPTNVVALANNGSADVSWSAPTSDGGSSITGYTVTASPGGQTVTVSGSTLATTFPGLANGTTYTFAVVATNAVGDSLPPAASNPVTPRIITVPGTPTGIAATAGNQSATVTWTPPTDEGGRPITSYTVVSNVGGFSATVNGTETSAIVTGLANGTSYRFRVYATNTIGNSPQSALSNAVTPKTVPGAPTNAAASAGNAQATISWTAPTSNGGSNITGYTITSSGGQTRTVGGTASSTTITGLTNGTSYTFTVLATNVAGSGPPSTPSNAVTPRTTPGAPTNVVASPGNGSATVTWTPSSDGGSPITSYTVSSNVGGFTTTVSGSETSAVLGGLANGTSYRFRVRATNVAGVGPLSALSNAVVPSGVPGAPTNVVASPGNGSASVTWSAASTNGSAIASYTVTSSGGQSTTVSGGTLQAIVSGLTNGQSYTFTVVATNAAGSGSASLPSAAVTPSVAATRIAFSSTRTGSLGSDLYMMNADGTNLVTLLRRSGPDNEPTLSPDGTRVVFVSGNNAAMEIWVMNIDGTGLTQLTTNGSVDQNPTWSPDGTQIAYSSNFPTAGTGGDLEIWVMHADGTNPAAITSNTAIDQQPDWSPPDGIGGSRIAWASNVNGNGYEIWIMDPDGTDQLRLTNSTGTNLIPEWSPNGTRIAFTSSRNGGDNDVFVMDSNGANQIDLTGASDPNNRQDVAPSWSPDGIRIAFASTRVSTPNYDILTMLANGTGVINLTNGTGNNSTPCWF